MQLRVCTATLVLLLMQMKSPALLRAADNPVDSKPDLSNAPYPPSKLIQSITWEWETYTNAAPGSDLWPVTWGPDDNLYVAWGDGGGFGGTDSDGRVAMGIGRIEGGPENWSGFNVNGGKNPEHPATFQKRGKTSALLSVQGTLYALVNLQDGTWPDVNHALVWSQDKGAHWSQVDWVFPRGHFLPAKFVNFGKDYSGVPDSLAGSVYVCGQLPHEPGKYGKRISTLRVPMNKIRKEFEYVLMSGSLRYDVPGANKTFRTNDYIGTNDKSQSDFEDESGVFEDTNGVRIAGIVYNPGIKRFLLTCYHTGPGQLGVFEGENPWGPWSTIAYCENWGGMGVEGEGLSCEFPQKWMSADGLTLWCIFSAYGDGAKRGIKAHDRFNLVRVKLKRADTAR
jgi:hypothetical protein